MPPVVRAQLDYYAVLEITASADTADVNAAFRRLAWRYHPDRNPAPGATLQFQDINEAHQVLSDPARRAEYDAKWLSGTREHRRTEPRHVRQRARHGWRRRHRHLKTVLTALFSVLFVSTAWTFIYAAMNMAHSGSSGYLFDNPAPFTAAASSDCSFSMEMFPVTYIDQHGRRLTAWEADVHNCWGGSARVSSLPDLSPTRMYGATRFTAYR
ncbi:MAG TPA: J domain-containing protein [Candidatus Eisenbacteria bacterium]|nr:J domain-containing protein [Candidatus Eisenbacteria bacterium]